MNYENLKIATNAISQLLSFKTTHMSGKTWRFTTDQFTTVLSQFSHLKLTERWSVERFNTNPV